MSHDPEVIKSAHEKNKRRILGEGGLRMTEAEQRVLDEHVNIPEEKDAVER